MNGLGVGEVLVSRCPGKQVVLLVVAVLDEFR